MWDASTLNMESMGSVSCRVGGSGVSSSLMRYADPQADSVGKKTIENCKFCFQNLHHMMTQSVGVSHSTIRNGGRKSGLNRD